MFNVLCLVNEYTLLLSNLRNIWVAQCFCIVFLSLYDMYIPHFDIACLGTATIYHRMGVVFSHGIFCGFDQKTHSPDNVSSIEIGQYITIVIPVISYLPSKS